MTFTEAAAIMISGGASTSITYPDIITYADDDDYSGTITEHYGDKQKKVKVNFNLKGTVNEQITGLAFYDETGEKVGQISFSGFYVG